MIYEVRFTMQDLRVERTTIRIIKLNNFNIIYTPVDTNTR